MAVMDGTTTTQQRYLPFGQVRTDIGSIAQTDFGYTGQRKLDEGMGGIMDYKARFYSPYINRFLQPDTVVPGYENPQNLNRYSYVRNNPVKYLDPSGHGVDCGIGMGCVTPYTPPSTGGGGNPDRDDIIEDLQLPQPDELPCGGYLNCQQPVDEFLYSQLPFTSADVCASFQLDPAMCDASSWANISLYLSPTLGYSELALNFYTSPQILVPNLNNLAFNTQDLATTVDFFFAVIETGFVSAGCLAGPEGCGAGLLLSWEAFNLSGANGLETSLSLVSMASTGAADYIDDGVFGEPTHTSVTTFLVGGLSWDPIVDLAIDGYASGYNRGIFCGIDTIVNGLC